METRPQRLVVKTMDNVKVVKRDGHVLVTTDGICTLRRLDAETCLIEQPDTSRANRFAGNRCEFKSARKMSTVIRGGVPIATAFAQQRRKTTGGGSDSFALPFVDVSHVTNSGDSDVNVDVEVCHSERLRVTVEGSGDVHIEGNRLLGVGGMDVRASGLGILYCNVPVETQRLNIRVAKDGAVRMRAVECADLCVINSGAGDVQFASLRAIEARFELALFGDVSVGSGKLCDLEVVIAGSGDARLACDVGCCRAIVEGAGRLTRLNVLDRLELEHAGAGTVRVSVPHVAKSDDAHISSSDSDSDSSDNNMSDPDGDIVSGPVLTVSPSQ